MNGKIGVLTVAVCLLVASLVNSAAAKPIEPITNDYAEFINDPYPIGSNTITISFQHETYSSFTIYLYRYDDAVTYWSVDRYTRSGQFTYPATVDGIWRLLCYLPGYQPYWTDETRDTFAISDPYPSQGNLATDWGRHPLDWNIYQKAVEIIGGATSSYVAGQNIKAHVRNYFVSYTLPPGSYWFQTDLDMLSDLNTYGHYYGNCRSDAVILSAYARALGIPARIIEVYIHGTPELGDDLHYFAEFRLLNGTNYQWIPVDGHPSYDWFGITEANAGLNRVYYPYGHVDGVTIAATITSESTFIAATYTGENSYTTYPPPGWVSPTGFSDPDSGWSSETSAFDDNVGSYATTAIIPYDTWSKFLYLTHSAIISSKVRVLNTYSPTVCWYDIDVYKSETWTHVYEGYLPSSWYEISFSQGIVEQMRVRVKRVGGAPYSYILRLYEADFRV